MARKSAAKAKVIKAKGSEEFLKKKLPPIEETFEYMKQGFLTILQTSIELAQRVDNLDNLRSFSLRFWDDKRDLSYYKHLQDISVETYRALYDCTEEFSLDEFSKEDMKDYYENLVPKCEDIATEEDLAEALVKFITVKPFGEKMAALHQQILDEIKQREEIE